MGGILAMQPSFSSDSEKNEAFKIFGEWSAATIFIPMFLIVLAFTYFRRGGLSIESINIHIPDSLFFIIATLINIYLALLPTEWAI
jgi:hypothetical protein